MSGHNCFTILAQISSFLAYKYVIESILVSFHNLQFSIVNKGHYLISHELINNWGLLIRKKTLVVFDSTGTESCEVL